MSHFRDHWESRLTIEDERRQYWDRYYEGRTPAGIPSQFATFVCDYLKPSQAVVEFACGDGRDSFFFASHGYRVLGLDASAQAIALCREKLASNDEHAADFHQLHIAGDWAEEDIAKAAAKLRSHLGSNDPIVMYARFFLHVLTEEQEIVFLRLASKLLAGGLCAVEFRTHRDFYLKKETSPHYRRYIDPLVFHARAAAAGLEPVYFVEGFGYAKYKTDDAHVARFVLRERPQQ